METYGVNGNITAGGGFNFDVGIVRRQSDAEWRVYVSVGPSVGLDASIGVSGSTIKNYNGNKQIEFGQLEGYGSSDNYGVLFMDFQLILLQLILDNLVIH